MVIVEKKSIFVKLSVISQLLTLVKFINLRERPLMGVTFLNYSESQNRSDPVGTFEQKYQPL